MENREVLGSASASEVPARPPGSEYNFRSRSPSATTAPKNRRLGSVETQGAGSTRDLPPVTPPNSPTPSGAGNPPSGRSIHTLPTGNTEMPISTLIPNTVTAGVSSYNSTLVPIHGIEDPLPVPMDAHDRPTLHDMSAKNNNKNCRQKQHGDDAR